MQKKTPKKQIKKEMSIDDLAIIVAKGFSSMTETLDERFEQMDQKFEKRLKEMDQKIDQRFDGLGRRIDDLATNRTTREESRMLEMRVERIEKTLKLN